MIKQPLLLTAAGSATAQTAVDHSAHIGFMCFGDHGFGRSSRFRVRLEGQWRRAETVLTWQRLLLRPAPNFQLNKKFMLTGGYAFIKTHRYGAFPAREPSNEHRIYKQAPVIQRFPGLVWQNRFPIIGHAARCENRFRYLLHAYPVALG